MIPSLLMPKVRGWALQLRSEEPSKGDSQVRPEGLAQDRLSGFSKSFYIFGTVGLEQGASEMSVQMEESVCRNSLAGGRTGI